MTLFNGILWELKKLILRQEHERCRLVEKTFLKFSCAVEFIKSPGKRGWQDGMGKISDKLIYFGSTGKQVVQYGCNFTRNGISIRGCLIVSPCLEVRVKT